MKLNDSLNENVKGVFEKPVLISTCRETTWVVKPAGS